jgi:hypothetical protein
MCHKPFGKISNWVCGKVVVGFSAVSSGRSALLPLDECDREAEVLLYAIFVSVCEIQPRSFLSVVSRRVSYIS